MGNILDELAMLCSVRHSQMHGRTALQFVLRSSQRGNIQLGRVSSIDVVWALCVPVRTASARRRTRWRRP
jgi:hypothetical protein